MKTIAQNRKAYYDYFVQDSIEAGIVLTGTEIKSIRAGRVNLRDAYAKPEGGELWLLNVHIARYEAGSHSNHEPRRPRKLLLHRPEIDELASKVATKGLTIVPLRLYLKGSIAKVELGLGKGKKLHDKRRAIAERDAEREMRQARKPGRTGGG